MLHTWIYYKDGLIGILGVSKYLKFELHKKKVILKTSS